MALENFKKAIIALEHEMYSTKDMNKKIETVKMYLLGFYYKSIEEYHLAKYPESKQSVRLYAVLAGKMLGIEDPFYHNAVEVADARDGQISLAFKNKKRHLVNYIDSEINAAKKTSYRAFEFNADKIDKLQALIPDEHRYKSVMLDCEIEIDSDKIDSSSPNNRRILKHVLQSFQVMMYFIV